MAVWNVIAEDTLSAAASSFTLSSISSSYDHLYMVVSARDDKSAYFNSLEFRFNNTSTPYSNTYLYAHSGTVSSTRDSGGSIGDVISIMASASTLADTFSTTTLWIPNYSNTSNDKQCIIN